MLSRLFQISNVSAWMEISVIFFALIFLAILTWTYLPIRKVVYEEAGSLPLKDKEHD